MGPDKQIHAVIRAVLTPDRATAGAVARNALGFHLQLAAYHCSWAGDDVCGEDFAGIRSDRLMDIRLRVEVTWRCARLFGPTWTTGHRKLT